MTGLRTFLLLAFFAAIASAMSATTAAAPFLHAVAVVENAPEGQRGSAGEIGPWQLLPGTRADRMRDLRVKGILHPTERQLALEHFAWLQVQLTRRGVDPQPFNMALAWNCGAKATATGRGPDISYRYARRVCAIMETSPP